MSTIPTPTPPDEHISDLFAKVTDLDPCCWRLLGLLVAEQGDGGRAESGRNDIARYFRWPPSLVSEHMRHLEAADLVEVERPPFSRVIYHVVILWWDGSGFRGAVDRHYLDGIEW